MKILIDLQGAQSTSRSRGIGRYSIALSRAIVRIDNKHDFYFLLNGLFSDTIENIKNSFKGIVPEDHFIVFDAPAPVNELPPENSCRVRAAELIREHFINGINPDIVLITSLFEGIDDNSITSIKAIPARAKVVAILYDLIPLISSEDLYGWDRFRNWYLRKIESLKKADLLLSISESSKNEGIQYLNIDPRRIINISSAADERFTSLFLTEDKKKNILTKHRISKRFIMHASAYDPRKNFDGLIRAFGKLGKDIRNSFQLVLVCKINEVDKIHLQKIAADHGIKDGDLILTNLIPDDELIALYSSCEVFVFPSFHEGFGLPILEAMKCGAAVIGSNCSSIPEVIGREDALFDPKSDESIANHIGKVITDRQFYHSLKVHGSLHSQKFNWDASAKKALHAIENLFLNEIESEKQICSINNNDIISEISSLSNTIQLTDNDIQQISKCISSNELKTIYLKSSTAYGGCFSWRIEGPFDSTYSLALLNRETARALQQIGCKVAITEDLPGFKANPEFLLCNSDIARMHNNIGFFSHDKVDVSSLNTYPPVVKNLKSKFNMLHHYAWEETGFPQEWVEEFNLHLHGLTCLSTHIEKILIDAGVSIPMFTSGCGVDHWERIKPSSYRVNAKGFRFLHVSSCFPRKGADILLDAFELAFTSDDDVTLIIKTFPNIHNDIHARIAEKRSKNPSFPDLAVIDGDISDADLKSLYHFCDVLVAPSKAEGFGLPMAEAMLSGLPVITTAWGGQLDFCNSENSWLVDYEFEKTSSHFGIYSSAWAKPHLSQLVDALVQARRSTKEHLVEKATSGRKLLLNHFKWSDVASRALKSARIWSSANYSNIPKVGFVTPWNTKCGIATYAQHLVSNIPTDVTILAPILGSAKPVISDRENVVRCWYQDQEINNFRKLSDVISDKKLDVLLINFQYGFFNNPDFFEFIEQQLNVERVILIVMHATWAPFREHLEILQRCHRILVHSINDLNNLKSIGLVKNVTLFPHGVLKNTTTVRIERKMNLPLVASYGFFLPHKGLDALVEAIGLLNSQGHPFLLRMVNAEYPDAESRKLIHTVKQRVRELEIDHLVEMHTEFLDDDKSLRLLNESDLIVFGYNKTSESASGAVRYGLAANRPVAVTPLNIFSDLGNAVFYFDGTSPAHIASGISHIIKELSDNSENAKNIELSAQKWREQHDYAKIAKRLWNMIISVYNRNYAFYDSL